MIHNRFPAKIHGELVLALESARVRLSIAIAVETKSTTPDRWNYYLDTTAQVGRFVRKLRKADADSRPNVQEWIRALERLSGLPHQVRASRLCQILRDILAELE